METVCTKCGRMMVYEPYFKTHICRQCGYSFAKTPQKAGALKANRIKIAKPLTAKTVPIKVG